MEYRLGSLTRFKPLLHICSLKNATVFFRRGRGRGRRGSDCEGDDGDYATLRELPMSSSCSLQHSDDTTSEENKVSDLCIR
jgi:hypothetical protein